MQIPRLITSDSLKIQWPWHSTKNDVYVVNVINKHEQVST